MADVACLCMSEQRDEYFGLYHITMDTFLHLCEDENIFDNVQMRKNKMEMLTVLL